MELFGTLFVRCCKQLVSVVTVSTLALLLVDSGRSVQGLSASCKCVTFVDTYGKEYGVFTSPNWPAPYEDNIDCLLYTFKAAKGQLVEITFDEFDVQKTSLDCVYADYVKLYLHIEDDDDEGIGDSKQGSSTASSSRTLAPSALESQSTIGPNSLWNDVLCGKIADVEQTHYSSSSTLIFEFHTDWRTGNNTGFRGTYRFLSKRLFETDGILMPNTRCDYKFESLITLPMAGNGTFNVGRSSNRGRFYSPQYPSTYPKSIQCSYIFEGQPSERIKLVFEHIMLQKSDLSCLNSPDVMYVHDGPNKSSPVIGQLCNTNAFVDFVSTGRQLYMQFLSRSHFPGQGFKGRFYFEPINAYSALPSNYLVPSTASESENMFSSKNSNSITTARDFASSNCDFNFSSDMSKSGTFTSPNHPHAYGPNVVCNYQFNGSGKERIQIYFTNFSLNMPSEEPPIKDCESVDAVMVYVMINGNKERLDNFCGLEVPQQMMSNGPSMRVEFRSVQSSLVPFSGFSAVYNYITNFGIATGEQDQLRVCAFVYNSTRHPNGTFNSPNHPGLYPRDTECHYFFYGKANERVHITFAYFDVEGVPPCLADSASDYVEFSNYKAVDRKIPRHCGIKRPKTIESDGDFFRVTFKSNDRFDGTGFEAFYQFRSPDDTFSVKKMRGLAASSNSFRGQFTDCLDTFVRLNLIVIVLIMIV
ncbi:Suppressor of lurcher protein 1 [Halotydeus destructor]|nr:Suppressor of lurcher protein 1 [Halotydeus destructor]